MNKYRRKFQESSEVAKEILAQLGGQKFIVMTGAKNFVSADVGDGQLSFRLPRAKDSINHVSITLNGKDLYDVKFGMIRGVNYKIKKEFNDVYNDMLVDIFEKTTGLYTSL